MTVYTYDKDGTYTAPNGERMPTHRSVTASKLSVGSIIFISERNQYRSAAVTSIDRHPKNKSWRVVMTVDESGKVDKHEESASYARFNLQCTEEEVQADIERAMHIVIRRRLESIRGEVAHAMSELTKPHYTAKNTKLTNPKLQGYVSKFAQFENDLRAMYDEIGADLGIGAPKFIKKK